MVVFTSVTTEEVARLLKRKYQMLPTKTIHEDLRFSKEGCTLVLYKSGKLLVQGKDTEKVVEELHALHIGTEEKKQNFRKETGWVIGSDEVLKGDTFGGIIVAAVKADDALRTQLRQLGVADSKLLSDAEILPLAEAIKKIAPCEIKNLLPEEYNKHPKLTVLLNSLHKECAHYLLPGKHIVDKYPGCNVGDVMEEKAESKYVEVAAASVLARAAALQQLNYLSKEAGFSIPKGSTHVELALQELRERKLDPKLFVKLHFRNVAEFLEKGM